MSPAQWALVVLVLTDDICCTAQTIYPTGPLSISCYGNCKTVQLVGCGGPWLNNVDCGGGTDNGCFVVNNAGWESFNKVTASPQLHSFVLLSSV